MAKCAQAQEWDEKASIFKMLQPDSPCCWGLRGKLWMSTGLEECSTLPSDKGLRAPVDCAGLWSHKSSALTVWPRAFSSHHRRRIENLNGWPSSQGDIVAMATPPVLALKHLCRALMTNARSEGGGRRQHFKVLWISFVNFSNMPLSTFNAAEKGLQNDFLSH